MGAQDIIGAQGRPPNDDSGSESKVGGSVRHLIEQARDGCQTAIGQLLQRYQKYLLLVANESLDSDLRSKGGASDLVQDTFLEAHKDFLHFQGTTEHELLAWLMTILTHRLSNNVRRYRHTLKRDVEREVSLEVCGDLENYGSLSRQVVAPVQALIAGDEAMRLQAALRQLPERMREVLILSMELQTFVEIAARLQTTPDSVRKLWGRAVDRLQIELQE